MGPDRQPFSTHWRLTVKPILDGSTITATLPAKGMWDALTITYRPALPEEVADYQAQPGGSGKRWLDSVWKFLSGKLQSWDLQTATAEAGNWQPFPVTRENLAKLPAPIIGRIVDVVTGYSLEDLGHDEKN